MKHLKYCLLLIAVTLSGCSLLPNAGPLAGKEVAEVDRSIVDGKTTVTELRSTYGEKAIAEPLPEGRMVMNWYRTWSAGFTKDTTVLSVLTENNVVVKHTVLRYRVTTDFSFVSSLTDADLAKTIVAGQTTRQQIEQKYGQPNDNSYDAQGDRVMLYIYADASKSQYGWIPNVGGLIEGLAGSATADVTILRIPVDERGVAKSFQLKTTKFKQGLGLLNASAPEEVK